MNIVLRKNIDKILNKRQIEGFPKVRYRNLRGVLMSFILMVVIPMLLSAVYFYSFAVTVYETEARVAVRKEAVLSQDSVGVSLGSASALSIFADSFIVAEYAKSRKMVERVMKAVDLGHMFSKGRGDPLYTYPTNARIEELVVCWQDMVDADFDASTGIITLKVRAFGQKDALIIADNLVQTLEKLVMKLSEKAQKEAVRFAEVDLEKAIEGLGKHRIAMQNFRVKNDIVDPSSEVANLNTLITTLSQELIKLKTERAVMGATSINNPKIRQLNIKIKNTLKIIDEIKRGKGNFTFVAKLPELLRNYELLRTNLDVANQQYVKSLERLGGAQASAVLRQAHLYVFVPFSLPQAPLRPNLPRDPLKMLLIALAAWGLYRLIK